MITMYNCGFGDCFKICHSEPDKNGFSDNDLIVDFGIHDKCGVSLCDRKERYSEIYKDLSKGNSDFLLTHYHADHYDGALYADDNHFKFNNVYIPDIWGEKDSLPVTVILLLGLFTDSYLKDRTLFDFLKTLCEIDGTVFFVKRGTSIQGRFTALWPCRSYMCDRAGKIVKRFAERPYLRKISEISAGLEDVMKSINDSDRREENIRILLDLKKEYQDLKNIVGSDYSAQKILSKYDNEISIVFHNSEDGDHNVLFTGDFAEKNWKYINDDKLSMYKNYSVIKVPHHGTGPYYHNFTNLINSDSKLLIPNGVDRKRWNIDDRYSKDINTEDASAICSDCQGCKAYLSSKKCLCKKHAIISPNCSIKV